jgi:tetratricopeptide (TPR) repeat protein
MWFVQWCRKNFFVVVGILLSACAGRSTAFLEKPPPADSTVDAAALRSEADKLWKQRDDPKLARQALTLYRRAFTGDPTNAELGTRLARAFHFVGHYVDDNRDARDSTFLRGAETGERVLALNEDFMSVYLKRKDLGHALPALGQDWIIPIYWTAMNLGAWAALQKSSVRYGNKGNVEALMTRVKELNPDFFYGAVYRFFGVLPTAGREPFVDLDKAKPEFDKAVALAPNCFTNKVMYAATYAIKKKDRELFERLLKEVVAGNPNALPDIAPENKYEQVIAKKLLEKIDDYFVPADKSEEEEQ